MQEALTLNIFTRYQAISCQQKYTQSDLHDLLTTLGYTYKKISETKGDFTVRGANTTVSLDENTLLIIKLRRNIIESLWLYDTALESIAPAHSHPLPDLASTNTEATCALQNIAPETLISPTLIPLFLNKKTRKNFLTIENWHMFLHTQTPTLWTYRNLLDHHPLPELAAHTQKTSAQSLTCHPHSAFPLEGEDNKTIQYKTLDKADHNTPHVWVQDSIPHAFLWGERLISPVGSRATAQALSLEKSFAFSEGDYVIHTEYGLGRFQGIECFQDGKKNIDCLRIVYADNTMVYIPSIDAYNIHFFADKDEDITLGDISKKTWLLKKGKHVEDIEKFAKKMLETAAKRMLLGAPSMMTDFSLLQKFSEPFPHTLTQDQQHALNDIIIDISKAKPMNRLLCADVAFGKTEVSMRAAFIATTQGWQVLVVAPTVLLCMQHFERYKERFAQCNIRCAMLSKLVPENERTNIKMQIKKHSIDVLFTTHAAFHDSVCFAALGLCIIDEEHLFGVTQKESIKERYPNAHILALSATPIPRTLHMALSKINDISTINTPPKTLRSKPVNVQTHVNTPSFIKRYIEERLEHGQIFCVVPHIKNLIFYENILRDCAPYTVLTGKSSPEDMRANLTLFLHEKCPILLSTNIVGLGMDVPNVNTLVVADAHLFGLSQLYQLRGRIGRKTTQGSVLLLHPPKSTLTPSAEKRIAYIEEHTHLGSHMAIARLDMHMRGTGRMIGKEQAGHYFNLGPSLYQTLLASSIRKARSTQQNAPLDVHTTMPEVSFPYSARLTSDYIADDHERINLYRMSTRIKTQNELEDLKKECEQLYGQEDTQAHNWFTLMKIRLLAHAYGIRHLRVSTDGLVVSWSNNANFLKKSTEDLLSLLEDSRIAPEGEHNLKFRVCITKPDEAIDALLQLAKILNISQR